MKAWQYIALGIGLLALAGARAMRWPVAGVVTSGYGMRDGRMHNGVDIAAPVGTPVLAPFAGTVIAGFFDQEHGGGNTLIVELDNALRAGFAHLASFAAAVGDRVAPGQVIATVGATGNATGPHLHYSLRRDGAFIDPQTVPHV